MKNNLNNRPHENAVNNAVSVLQQELTALRKELHGKTGEERAAIEQKIQQRLAGLGFESVELETRDDNDSDQTTAAKLAARAASLVADATKINEDHATATGGATKVEVKAEATVGEKPGLWARFKAWVADNKAKVVVGSLTILAGAAGLWYWISGKNTGTAVSSVSRIADTNVELEVPAQTDGGGVFARIGDWIVGVTSAVKGYAVSAWNWVTGLFSRNTTTETTVDAQPEVVVLA